MQILRDMQGPAPMMRLLQGDVGSGKTAVAMLALLAAAGSGWQGALMAPTEVRHPHVPLTYCLPAYNNLCLSFWVLSVSSITLHMFTSAFALQIHPFLRLRSVLLV